MAEDNPFKVLGEKLKRFTWLIQTSHKETEAYATGFALDLNLAEDNCTVLISCSHIFRNGRADSIRVRSLDDEDFDLKAEIVVTKPSLDVSILMVKGTKNVACAKFAEDGAISIGETLLHVGHAHNFVWSFFVGRAAYQCVNNVDFNFSNKGTCGSYVLSSMKKTLIHRIMGDVWDKESFAQNKQHRLMGDIWNEDHFDQNKQSLFKFEKNLSANTPIIQCAGLGFRETCSGGPVFNREGHIVGLIIGEFERSQIAVHLTVLKQYVNLNTKAIEDFCKEKATANYSKDVNQLKRKKGPM